MAGLWLRLRFLLLLSALFAVIQPTFAYDGLPHLPQRVESNTERLAMRSWQTPRKQRNQRGCSMSQCMGVLSRLTLGRAQSITEFWRVSSRAIRSLPGSLFGYFRARQELCQMVLGRISPTSSESLSKHLNDIIWAFPNGRLTIGPTPAANSGSFIHFLPGGGLP